MNISEYKKTIGTKTNIHKVSLFFKENFQEIKNKKLLFLDFEFTAERNIYEVGGFILNNRKVEKQFLKSFQYQVLIKFGLLKKILLFQLLI